MAKRPARLVGVFPKIFPRRRRAVELKRHFDFAMSMMVSARFSPPDLLALGHHGKIGLPGHRGGEPRRAAADRTP
jgi:hypothetical protein